MTSLFTYPSDAPPEVHGASCSPERWQAFQTQLGASLEQSDDFWREKVRLHKIQRLQLTEPVPRRPRC